MNINEHLWRGCCYIGKRNVGTSIETRLIFKDATYSFNVKEHLVDLH